MMDLEAILLSNDPVSSIKNLVALVENVQAQQKIILEMLRARSEMTKIAIAALQRVAIDPDDKRIGMNAAVALDRMKEIWLTSEKLTGGRIDAEARHDQVKF